MCSTPRRGVCTTRKDLALNASSRRRLATVTIPAPDLRPEDFLRQATGEARGFWARADRWVAHRGVAAELRCENAWEPLLYARSRIVHAAASIGVDAIDVPYLDLEDPDGMVEEATLSRDLGFSGKGSIHPKQIAALNEVFTPSEADVARARRIIQTFEEADTGLVVIDGKLIEKPVLRDMHRIIAVADRMGM